MRNTVRIPLAPAPQFFAGIEIMTADRIAADNQQPRNAADRKRDRRTKSLTRFANCLTWTDMPPDRLARLAVDRQQVRFGAFDPATPNGFIPLEHLQIQPAIDQRRAAAEGPQKSELPVVVLNIAGPKPISLQVKADQNARPVKKDHHFAVRNRRRRREIAASVLACALSRLMSPQNLPIGPIQARRNERFGFRVRAGNKHATLPDDRRSRGCTRHLNAPGNILRRAPM